MRRSSCFVVLRSSNLLPGCQMPIAVCKNVMNLPIRCEKIRESYSYLHSACTPMVPEVFTNSRLHAEHTSTYDRILENSDESSPINYLPSVMFVASIVCANESVAIFHWMMCGGSFSSAYKFVRQSDDGCTVGVT